MTAQSKKMREQVRGHPVVAVGIVSALAFIGFAFLGSAFDRLKPASVAMSP